MANILRLAYLTGFQFATGATPPKFVANPGANPETRRSANVPAPK